jgi:hypothetical protein
MKLVSTKKVKLLAYSVLIDAVLVGLILYILNGVIQMAERVEKAPNMWQLQLGLLAVVGILVIVLVYNLIVQSGIFFSSNSIDFELKDVVSVEIEEREMRYSRGFGIRYFKVTFNFSDNTFKDILLDTKQTFTLKEKLDQDKRIKVEISSRA